MPHIIVEYSKNLGDIINISKLVYDLHEELAAQGVDKERIKTRALACNYVSVGEQDSRGHMLHLTLLLLEGRDNATKKQYGDALHNMMKDCVGDVVKHCSITLEIRDMVKDTYYM